MSDIGRIALGGFVFGCVMGVLVSTMYWFDGMAASVTSLQRDSQKSIDGLADALERNFVCLPVSRVEKK